MTEGGDQMVPAQSRWWPAVGLVDLLLIPALLLPWVRDNGDEFTGLELGWWLPAATLLTVLGRVAAAVARPPWWSDRVRRGVTVWSAVLLGASALGAAIVTAEEERGELRPAGTVAFLAVVVLAAGLEFHRPAEPGRPRLRELTMLAGTAGLVAAVVGVLGTWERISGPAARALSGGGDLVWTAAELDDTLALRWLVGALLAAAILLLSMPRLRSVLPVVLLGGGVVVAITAGAAATSIPRHAVTTDLLPGSGVWLALAGGVVAAVGGAVGLLTRRPRAATPAVVAAALALGLVAPVVTPAPAARAADRGDARVIFADPSDYDFRIGGPLRDSQVGTDTTDGVDAVQDTAGRLWFLSTTRLRGERVAVVQQAVGDRALPVTVIRTDFSEPRLLAVAAGNAIVRTELERINRIDLRSGDVTPESGYGGSRSDGAGAVALRAQLGGDGGAGTVAARTLRVNSLADGSIDVVALGGELDGKEYVVPARTVAGPAPWPLPAAVSRREFGVVPRPGVVLTKAGDTLRQRVAGRTTPVLARTTDPRCALSRDPLALPSDTLFLLSQRTLARDAAGNLFVKVDRGRGAGLFVVTPGGELRRIELGDRVRTVQATPAGGLIVLTTDAEQRRRVLLIRDSARAADGAERLPAPRSGCVADERATVRTAGRMVRAGAVLASPSGLPTLLSADGTRLVPAGTPGVATLERVGADGRTRRLAAVGSGEFFGVVADGRGGGWWFQREREGTPQLWHVDVDGRTRRMPDPDGLISGLGERNAGGSADPADGSLYWQPSGQRDEPYRRSTTDGTTATTRFTGYSLLPSDGVAYVQYGGKPYVTRVDPAGNSLVVLGYSDRTTSVLDAVRRGAGPDAIPADGLAADAEGRLLAWQGRWLGRVSGGKVTMLSGPADGLPDRDDVSSVTVVGSQLIFVSQGRVCRVDVR